MFAKKNKEPTIKLSKVTTQEDLEKVGQIASDNYVKRTNEDTFAQINDRIQNDILTYSIEGNNEYLKFIISSVKEGMPPVVNQDSLLEEADLTDVIDALQSSEDAFPGDYVPDAEKLSTNTEGDVEVSIL